MKIGIIFEGVVIDKQILTFNPHKIVEGLDGVHETSNTPTFSIPDTQERMEDYAYKLYFMSTFQEKYDCTVKDEVIETIRCLRENEHDIVLISKRKKHITIVEEETCLFYKRIIQFILEDNNLDDIKCFYCYDCNIAQALSCLGIDVLISNNIYDLNNCIQYNIRPILVGSKSCVASVQDYVLSIKDILCLQGI